jgi:hypothetical protein
MSSNVNGGDNSNLSSPALIKNNHVTPSTPHSESKIRIPIIRNNSYSLIKSASTSDIPLATKAKFDSTTMSESEVLKVF